MQDLHHGQEIYLFFNKYGLLGLFGILTSLSILCLIIYKSLMLINRSSDIKVYSDLVNKIINKKVSNKYFNIGNIIKNIINIFLIISFFIMVAGFGAYFKQEFNSSTGSIIMASLCFITFNKDINGVVKVNTFIVPAIIVLITLLGLKSTNEISNISLQISNTQSSFKWLISSILYASYNSILLIPILITLKKYVKEKKQIKAICFICMLILLILSIIIFLLIETIDNPQNIELPLVYIAGNLKVIYKYLYGIVILSAIFTTAISAGYGFLSNVAKNKKAYRYLNVLITISSIFVANIGFSNLVNYLYPVFGVLGMVQIAYLVKNKKV